MEDYSNRITVGDVNNLNFGSSSKGTSMMTSESQRELIQNLQLEMEKNMREIELLKQKLQVKNQVIGNYQEDCLKGRPSYFQRPTVFTNPFECGGLLCGMGESSGRSTVRGFMERDSIRNAVEPQRETNDRGFLQEFGFNP